MSIVLVGSTSGSITLQEPAVAGTTVLSLPATSGTLITTGSPQSGSVLQVVNSNTSASSSTTSSSFVDMGSTSATITPKFASSKILVSFCASHTQANASSLAAAYRLVRDSTELIVFANSVHFLNLSGINEFCPGGLAFEYLDTPNTTSAITYKPQFRIRFGTGTTSIEGRSITLLEIAA